VMAPTPCEGSPELVEGTGAITKPFYPERSIDKC